MLASRTCTIFSKNSIKLTIHARMALIDKKYLKNRAKKYLVKTM